MVRKVQEENIGSSYGQEWKPHPKNVRRGLLSVTGMSHSTVGKYGELLQRELKLAHCGPQEECWVWGDGQVECGPRPRKMEQTTARETFRDIQRNH